MMSGGTMKSSFTSSLPIIRVSTADILPVYPIQIVLSLTAGSEAQKGAFTKSMNTSFVGFYL